MFTSPLKEDPRPELTSNDRLRLKFKKIAQEIEPDQAILLDVQEQKERDQEGFVKGAVALPWSRINSDAKVLDRIRELADNKKIYVYYAAGVRASKTAALLKEHHADAEGIGGLSDCRQFGPQFEIESPLIAPGAPVYV